MISIYIILKLLSIKNKTKNKFKYLFIKVIIIT
jgi:hypothetical protein